MRPKGQRPWQFSAVRRRISLAAVLGARLVGAPAASLLQKLLRGRARRYRNRHSCDNRRTSRTKQIKRSGGARCCQDSPTPPPAAAAAAPAYSSATRGGLCRLDLLLPVLLLCRRVRKPRGRAHLLLLSVGACAPIPCLPPFVRAGWASLTNILGGSCSKTTALPRSGIKLQTVAVVSLSFREKASGRALERTVLFFGVFCAQPPLLKGSATVHWCRHTRRTVINGPLPSVRTRCSSWTRVGSFWFIDSRVYQH